MAPRRSRRGPTDWTGAALWTGQRLAACAAILNGILAAAPSVGAASAENVHPRAFDLQIPPGPLLQESGLRFATRDEDGQEVVALGHCAVGDYRIVMMPDGQLASRRKSEAPATDRPFEARSKDEIARRLTAAALQGFRTKQTRRYLYVYNASEPFALAASRILETMYPGVFAYARAQHIEVHSPPSPLVVVMFRTEKEFQSHGAMPPGVTAYYNTVTNRVVMYEQKQLAQIDPQLAAQQSISIIAHEGAHQILNNIGVQQRLAVWPTWLSEGLAEFFAPTSTGKRLKWRGAGQVNDLRMFELEQYLKARASDRPDGRMIEQTVSGARLTSTGYAAAWALTHYLANKRRAQFHEYVREVSGTGPLEGNIAATTAGLIPQQAEAFRERFGHDLAAIEGQLVLHLQHLPYAYPFADWPHYVVMLSANQHRPARREANVFPFPQLAERWQREMLEKAAADQRSGVQTSIRQFPNRAAAESFARQWLKGL